MTVKYGILKTLLPYSLIISLASGLMTGCDAPRSERRTSAGSASSTDLFFNPVGGTSGGTTTGGSSTGGSTTGGDTGSVTIPNEVSHCNWSPDGQNGFQSAAAHMAPDETTASNGNYTLCQSTTNPLDVYLQVKNPITSEQLCLIPTYHSAGNSVYIGEPRCLYVRSNTTLYKITLVKNRSGFSTYPVTGVMMMRDKAYEYGAPFYQVILSPDAYIFCSQWLAQYGDPSYCIPFKSAGHYIYHQF